MKNKVKYSKEFNKEARYIVSNYNARVKRAKAAGLKRVPEPVKLSELKALGRSSLNKQLNLLKSFNRNTSLKTVELAGGAITTKFQLQNIKTNLTGAKIYFASEVARREKRNLRFPSERLLLINTQEKEALLYKDIQSLSPEDFRSFVATIREYENYPAKRRAGYRGFLSEVDNVMQMLGYPEETINKLINKFNVLNPDQFFYAYDNSDLIARVYELADSPIYGELKLNTTDDDAIDLINTLMEEADDIIKDAIENVD